LAKITSKAGRGKIIKKNMKNSLDMPYANQKKDWRASYSLQKIGVPAIAFGESWCSLLDAFRNNSIEINIKLSTIQKIYSSLNITL